MAVPRTRARAAGPPHKRFVERIEPRAARPLIKVYGERNAGTQYLAGLLVRNLPITLLDGTVPQPIFRLQKLAPGRDLVRDVYFWLTAGFNLGWKHALVETLPRCAWRCRARRDIRVVTITKNPYSWALSMARKPYHRRGPAFDSLEALLQRPWRTVGRENAPLAFRNLIAMWNRKNAAYLRPVGGFPTINLRYEDLLADPEATLGRVAAALGLATRGPFRNVRESANGDQAETYDSYRRYYLDERWKAKLTPRAIALINASLDRDLMAQFGYEVLD
jgi:hypothetical protein